MCGCHPKTETPCDTRIPFIHKLTEIRSTSEIITVLHSSVIQFSIDTGSTTCWLFHWQKSTYRFIIVL